MLGSLESKVIESSISVSGVLVICSNVSVGGRCQSKVHINARAQGFPAEHYSVMR